MKNLLFILIIFKTSSVLAAGYWSIPACEREHTNMEDVLSPKENEFLNGFSQKQNKDSIEKLIELKVDVNIAGENGNTAIIKSAKNKNVEAVLALAKKGANLEAKNKFGETPLMQAAQQSGAQKTLLALSKNGANLEAKNNQGETALMLAVSSLHTENVRTLAKEGGDANTKNNQGETPLRVAAEKGDVETFLVLIQKTLVPLMNVARIKPGFRDKIFRNLIGSMESVVIQNTINKAYVIAKEKDDTKTTEALHLLL